MQDARALALSLHPPLPECHHKLKPQHLKLTTLILAKSFHSWQPQASCIRQPEETAFYSEDGGPGKQEIGAGSPGQLTAELCLDLGGRSPAGAAKRGMIPGGAGFALCAPRESNHDSKTCLSS